MLQQLDAIAPSSAELRAFAGEYISLDLEVTYRLAARDSELVIQIPGRRKDIVLQPIFPDGFAGELVGVVKFARDARGAVTGFTVNTYGVRSLRFDRVKRSGSTESGRGDSTVAAWSRSHVGEPFRCVRGRCGKSRASFGWRIREEHTQPPAYTARPKRTTERAEVEHG